MSNTFTFSSSSDLNDFKSLKEQLKDITKIGNGNRNVQGWSTDLQLWIQLQNITDSKTIFYGCLLTSQGDAQRLINDLKESERDEDLSMKESDLEEEESEEESEGDEEGKSEEYYPSFDKIVRAVKQLYGILEDQTTLLKKIRTLRIRKNESVRDFNTRYRNLYTQLDKKKRKLISVLDYVDSLQPNYEAWKRVSLRSEELSLERAYLVAERVDRLRRINEITPSQQLDSNGKRHSNRSYKEEYSSPVTNSEKITCFYCKKKGHYQASCPTLNDLIKKNKEEIFTQSHHLN